LLPFLPRCADSNNPADSEMKTAKRYLQKGAKSVVDQCLRFTTYDAQVAVLRRALFDPKLENHMREVGFNAKEVTEKLACFNQLTKTFQEVNERTSKNGKGDRDKNKKEYQMALLSSMVGTPENEDQQSSGTIPKLKQPVGKQKPASARSLASFFGLKE